LTLGPVREGKIGVKMTQTTRKLARFANRPGFVLLVLALIVTVSVTAYALVTHRNPFCLPLTASGSFVSMTVAELTRASETILRGAVRQIGPSWQSWQSTSWTVFTDITVDATEFLKNPQPQTTVQLRIHGGYTTCGGLIVSGQASFVKGEEGEQVLLFLATSNLDSPDTYLAIVGGPQGKYTIENKNAWWGSPSNAAPLDELIAEINRNL